MRVFDGATDFRTNQRIDFITDNPGMEEFRKQEKFTQETIGRDQQLAASDLTNRENVASSGSRLRQIDANSNLAVTAADVAGRTANDKVARSGAETSDALVGARINRATEGDKVQGSRLGLRRQEAQTLQDELKPAKDVIELALRDPNAARVLRDQSGLTQKIPDALLSNREWLIAIKNGSDYADKAYRTDPNAYTKYMSLYATHIKGVQEGGGDITNASLPHALTGQPGVPTPADSTFADRYTFMPGTGTKPGTNEQVPGIWKGNSTDGSLEFSHEGTITGRGGAGGDASVYKQKLIVGNALYGEGTKEAADYANGRRSLTEAEMRRFAIAEAGRQEKYSATKRQALEDQIFNALRKSGTTPAPAPAPAAPPVRPAAQRPDMMTPGNGSTPPIPMAPANPALREVNKVYQAPNGKLGRWTGQGWEIIQ